MANTTVTYKKNVWQYSKFLSRSETSSLYVYCVVFSFIDELCIVSYCMLHVSILGLNTKQVIKLILVRGGISIMKKYTVVGDQKHKVATSTAKIYHTSLV